MTWLSGGAAQTGGVTTDINAPIVDVGDPGYETDYGQYVWFDPFAELNSIIPVSDERYQYWCKTCGDYLSPQIFNKQSLVQGGSGAVAADFIPPNISALGLCGIFLQWMEKHFIDNGGVTGPPVAPGPPSGPPPDGGGVGG